MGGVAGVCFNPGAWTGGGDEVRIQIAWRQRHWLDAWTESADAPGPVCSQAAPILAALDKLLAAGLPVRP